MLTLSRTSTIRLSPLVAFVEDRGAADQRRMGAYHRLTGDGVELPGPLHELLLLLRKAQLELRELLRSTSVGGRALVDELQARHFLVTDHDPARLLRPFLTSRLVRPAMNPAVLCREGSGQEAPARVVRLKRADRCALPRTAAVPELLDEPLEPGAAGLLSRATTVGALSVAEAISLVPTGAAAGRQTDAAWAAIDFLTQPQRQLLRFVPEEVVARGVPGARHHYLNQSFVRSPAAVAPAATGYYRESIGDARWNFDWVETTVSHAFRFPTAALGMQSYGARLAQSVLRPGGLVPTPAGRPLDVLEVGGGIGTLAREFIPAARGLLGPGAALRYTIVDCSPTLSAAQRSELADTGCDVRFVVGDARELSRGRNGAEDRFDLLISNEMIADLPVTGPPRRREQTGSAAFLTEVAACLRADGVAVIIEYGKLNAPPRLVEHLNHPEHSVHFAPLLAQARQLGLGARLVPLQDLLHSNRDVEMACGQQEHVLCLNRVLAARGVAMPYAAFCRGELERRFGEALTELGVSGLPYAPLGHGLHFGPDLAEFQAMVLTGPDCRAPREGLQ